MKLYAIPILCLFCFVSLAYSSDQNYTNRYDSITTTDGTVYKRVSLKRREGDSILIYHSTGIVKVKISQMPDYILSDIGLQPGTQPVIKEEEQVLSDTKAITGTAVEFRTAVYYKSSDRHRIFAYYPSTAINIDNIPQDMWDKILQIGLNEMYTAGKTTRVFFYQDETSAYRTRLHQHSSYDAALQGAYYGKPFAIVEFMFDGSRWFTKYPETPRESAVELK